MCDERKIMEKVVTMTLKGVQNLDGEISESEIITNAVFSTVRNGFKIVYEESEATGFEGEHTEITTCGNEMATIQRSGESGSLLVVEKDKKHHCRYFTPFGELSIGIYANAIENNLTADGGSLYLKYTVDANSSYISDNEVMIQISG